MSEAKFWLVSYTDRDGKAGSTPVEYPVEPSMEDAAIRVREHLLGKNFLLVDTPRGEKEPTVFLLKSYGFTITKIEQVL